MLSSSKVGMVLFAVGAVAAAGAARAYTIETHFTMKCHEKLTAQALRTARAQLGMPATPRSTENEQALIDDLQFAPDGDMRDLAGVTLLVGVRDNDLKGNSQDDLSILSAIHGDPATQREHCLRGPGEKEPAGSAAAVADCRAFIRGRVLEALDGLDAAGRPDLAKRTSLSLHLSLRGHVDAPLPTYYVRIGQAMHAVQDSFTHTYRTPDGMKITVVLNWLDEEGGSLVESRDGPGHATKLDVCDDPDDLRKAKRTLATDASTALLIATLDPSTTRDGKVAAVDQLLDTYLSYSPGCTFDNGWCQAAETQYKDSGKGLFGCTTAGAQQGPWAMVAWSAFALLALMGRRRWRRWGAFVARGLIVGAACTLAAGSARAQTDASKPSTPAVAPTATSTTTTTPAKAATSTAPAKPATVTTTSTTTTPAEPNTHAPPAPTIVAVEEPGPRDPSQTAWGAYVGSSGSFDKPAVAAQLGARLRVSKHWTFGLDGEWNPWISLNNSRFGSGVVNVYGTAILRFPLAYERFNLRATVNFGASYLLMNLFGAPAGSLGIYAGVCPAGLEWKFSRAFILIINPLGIALPVPQLRGVPLTYPQYRMSIGLEFYKG